MDESAKLFVIAAPSGAGKTTLVKALVKRIPDLKFSVSYTTRQRRSNETDGVDYLFVDEARFAELRENGELLESAQVFDNFYGTSRSQVEHHLAAGRHVILEIDWQGAQQVRSSMPDCVSIFVLPPSRTELERRLRDRKTDSDTVIERRLRDAVSDMQHWDEFDYVIINDSLDDATTELLEVLAGRSEDNRSSNTKLQARIGKVLG